MDRTKAKKIAKKSPAKPIAPKTRECTRAISQKAKEKAKEKRKATKQKGPVQKKQRRKYIAQPDLDDERTKSEDISQFKVVSHTPLSGLKNICENVKNNADLSRLKNIDFEKLGREEKNLVEESVYEMMSKFKNTPLELDNTMPKSLYDIIEQKWNYCLNLEKKNKRIYISPGNARIDKSADYQRQQEIWWKICTKI